MTTGSDKTPYFELETDGSTVAGVIQVDGRRGDIDLPQVVVGPLNRRPDEPLKLAIENLSGPEWEPFIDAWFRAIAEPIPAHRDPDAIEVEVVSVRVPGPLESGRLRCRLTLWGERDLLHSREYDVVVHGARDSHDPQAGDDSAASVDVEPFAGLVAVDHGTTSTSAVFYLLSYTVDRSGFLQEQIRCLAHQWDRFHQKDAVSDLGIGVAAAGPGVSLARELVEFEKQLVTTPGRSAALLELHDLYRQVFEVRIAESLDMWLFDLVRAEVTFNDAEAATLQSIIADVDGTWTLGNDLSRDQLVDPATRVYRGLKRSLRADMSEEKMLALQAFLWLMKQRIDRALTYDPMTRRDGKEISARNVVLTYPVLARSAERQMLGELMVKAGFGQVEDSYDEAIAASIYFLLRQFQGSLTVNYEAFRASCRAVDETTRVHNALVVDIGGGTADLALIEITLQDETQIVLREADVELGREAAEQGARAHRVSPRVLGSSGLVHNGGDRITLKLFHLLKTRMALSQDPAAHQVLGEHAGLFGPGEAGEIETLLQHRVVDGESQTIGNWVEARVSTRSEEVQDQGAKRERRQRFFELWERAEAAKISYATNGVTGIEPELTPGDVRAAVSSVALHVIREAVRLVEKRLPTGQLLDRVVLSGRTTSMELVQHEITQRLAGVGGWNGDNLSHYTSDEAKNAVPLGACYAYQLDRFTYQVPLASLKEGRSHVHVSVDNFLSELRTEFFVADRSDTAGSELPVFKLDSGDPVFFQDPAQPTSPDAPQPEASSQWFESVRESTQLSRERFSEPNYHWAFADISDLLGDEVWNRFRTTLRHRFLVDPYLSVDLELSNGQPLLESPGPAVARADFEARRSVETPEPFVHESSSGVARLAQPIEIDVSPPGFFDSGDETLIVRAQTAFDQRVAVGGELLHALVAPVPAYISPRKASNDLTFISGQHVATIRLPELPEWMDNPGSRSHSSRWLLVTEHGHLFVAYGTFSYTQLESEPTLAWPEGHVYRISMSPPDIDQSERRFDPFNGYQ